MKIQGKDKKSGLFWVFLGSLTCITAYRFGLGTMSNPGPGFLPFAWGLVMIMLSAALFIQAMRSEAGGEREVLQIGNGRILLSIVCFILYALAFRRVGFILTTFVLVISLLQIYEKKSWLTSLVISAITVFVSYMIFVVWLKVQLPKGLLGL